MAYDGAPPVLSGIDLTVDRGAVVVVLGPNGSGKSTLIRAILGLAPITTGRLELDGAPPTTRRRRRLGYVPQRHTVGGGVPATVEEVVGSGRLLRHRYLPPILSPSERGVITEAIATVGLTEKIGHPVATLSGGQQRRVLIARALAGEADTLVLDEPFAGVDTANQEILGHTLAGLVTTGTTLLIVTHELAPVSELADRVVYVEHGVIGYNGPPGRFLERTS